MCKKLTVHMKSGRTYDVDVVYETPEQAADAFYEAIDFVTTNSLKLGSTIFFLREVEAFTFR